MSWKEGLTLAVPAFGALVVAIVGAVAAIRGYRVNKELALHEERLARVSQQLSAFYGPLLALSSASHRSWIDFRRIYRPTNPDYWADPPPTDAELAAWRLWMTTVFMPLNREMRDLVVTKPDLLVEI